LEERKREKGRNKEREEYGREVIKKGINKEKGRM